MLSCRKTTSVSDCLTVNYNIEVVHSGYDRRNLAFGEQWVHKNEAKRGLGRRLFKGISVDLDSITGFVC